MHIQEIASAYKKRVFCGRIVNDENYIDPSKFLVACKGLLMLKIGDFLFKFRSPVKVNFELACEFVLKKGQTETLVEIFFVTEMTPLTISVDFNEWFVDNVLNPIAKKMSEFQERDSGKALRRIIHLQVRF